MKVLFTGTGSIGTRHIKNLISICDELGSEIEVDVLRKSQRVLPKELLNIIHKEIRSDSDLADSYDAIFLTDETSSHYINLMKYFNLSDNFFVEKPIFDSVDYDITKIESSKEKIIYVAAPIRFSKYYQKLKEIVENHEVYAARIIFSSYMPNWQKGRDYRKSFRCFAERGGGVDIDSLHEIDYMTALFGQPCSVSRIAGKYSNLEMDACDAAAYIFGYENKIVEMHLDYFGKVNNRRVEFFTKDDVIVVDYNKRTCVHQLTDRVEKYDVDDQFYQDEMRNFVQLINYKDTAKNINPVSNAMSSLRLAKGIL